MTSSIVANIKLPELTKKTVWAGTYGGHYSNIVFFSSKPYKSKESHRLIDVLQGKYYDCSDKRNQALIIGDMYLQDFFELYPQVNTTLLEPKAIEIVEVFKMELECFFDKDGDMHFPSFRNDW